MSQTTKLQNACYVADLLVDLSRKKVPLPSIDSLSTKLCLRLPERRRTTFITMVMRWKVRDAWAVVRRERYNNAKVWRDNKRVLQEEGVERDYDSVWEREKRRHWLFLRTKRKRRVKFLLGKFGSENVVGCVTEGITVAEQSGPSTF